MKSVLLKISIFFAVVIMIGFTACGSESGGGGGGGGNPVNSYPMFEEILDNEPTNASLETSVKNAFISILNDNNNFDESNYSMKFVQYKNNLPSSGFSRYLAANDKARSVNISAAILNSNKDEYYLNDDDSNKPYSVSYTLLSGDSAKIHLSKNGVVVTATIDDEAYGTYTIRVTIIIKGVSFSKEFSFNYPRPSQAQGIFEGVWLYDMGREKDTLTFTGNTYEYHAFGKDPDGKDFDVLEQGTFEYDSKNLTLHREERYSKGAEQMVPDPKTTTRYYEKTSNNSFSVADHSNSMTTYIRQ